MFSHGSLRVIRSPTILGRANIRVAIRFPNASYARSIRLASRAIR